MQTQNQNSDSLITTAQLAARLSVSPRSIEQWVRRRQIPFIKIGRSVRFDYRAVIEETTVNPQPVA